MGRIGLALASVAVGLLCGIGGAALAQMMGPGMMGPGGPGYGGHGGMMGGGYGSMARRMYYRMQGPPPAYRNLRDTVPPTSPNVRAGATLYGQQCAACHGARGFGDGPSAKDLNPPPANIAALMRTPFATDDYLYWTIAEGGAQFRSAMPAFKDVLKPDQIWQVILAMRMGFPGPDYGEGKK